MQVLGSTSGLFGDHTLQIWTLKEAQISSWFFCCSRWPLLPVHQFLFVCVSYLASGGRGGDMQVMFCLLATLWAALCSLWLRGHHTETPSPALEAPGRFRLTAEHFGFDPFFGSRSDQTWVKISTLTAAQFGDVWVLRQCPSMLLIQVGRKQV